MRSVKSLSVISLTPAFILRWSKSAKLASIFGPSRIWGALISKGSNISQIWKGGSIVLPIFGIVRSTQFQ